MTLVEQYALGAGSSGGFVGALAPHTPGQWNPKKQFQLDSLLMAEAFWAEVRSAGGVDPLYARTGRLQPLEAKGRDLAETRAIAAKELWQGRAEWRIIDRDSCTWGPNSASGLLIHDTLTARLHPRRAIEALAAALHVSGVQIVIGKHPPEGAVVWATGTAGLTQLSGVLGKPVGNGVKGQAALLDHDARVMAQIYADGVHIIPHGDGTVGIGSTSERDYEAPNTTDHQLDALIAKARQICPTLTDAKVIGRWASLRPRAKSRAPMLGPWPDRPGHFIANGGFKIGFGMAPKVAQTMADLVLEGRDTIPEGFCVTDNI